MLTTTRSQTPHRPRRNRKSAAIRALVQENHLNVTDLIYPLFIQEEGTGADPISSMPGIFRLSGEAILKEIETAVELGILGIALFPVIPKNDKDREGSEGVNPDGFLPKILKLIKEEFPEICLISDVALDPYTSHGHDGIVNQEGEVLNDETVEKLVQMALIQAQAGSDMVAPSDMMDGRVKEIRKALDAEGFSQVNILSYAAKYASAFYGPFRDALSSRLQFGDKKSYQMNPANRREALLEAKLDEEEGADILMIKPALAYLDVIAALRNATTLPLAAYQVSGEYAMIMAAAQKGWIDGESAFLESLLCIKRAGADMIFTYAAPQVAKALTNVALY